MKTWIRRTLIGVFGASVLFGATACSNYREHGRWNASPEEQARMRDRMVDRVARKLELNAEQRTKLNALADTLQAQRAAFREQGDPRTQMRGLIAGDKFDRAQARSMAERAAGAISTRSPAVIAAFADFYDSLDARQQAQVRDRLDRRHGWWHRG